MEVQTPYLARPIEVRGVGPYHVERHGCVVMVCDKAGHNSVCFHFDHAEVAAGEGGEVSAAMLESVPIWGSSILRDDVPEYLKLCDDIAAYLNQQTR